MLENYRKNIHQKNKNVKFNDEDDNQRDEDLYNVFGNPKKDKDGNPITKPLRVYPENSFSKLRRATEAEYNAYVEKHPRYKRRQESLEIIEGQEAKRKRGRPKGGGVLAGVDLGA